MSAKSLPTEALTDLLSLPQAAALSGLNARTLRRYVDAGRLHLFRSLLASIVRGDDGS